MSGAPNLRERRRAETRRLIQSRALRLFVEHGYDATTVNDVARASEVSPMTVYRHFPTKEDLVLHDRYDDLLAERVAARPADEPVVLRIGRTLVDTTRALVGTAGDGTSPERDLLLARLRLMVDTPALRARHLDSQYATRKAVVDALLGDAPDPEAEFRAQVAAGACLAAMHVALVRWAREDGRPDLPGLVAAALGAAFDDDFG
ncbi:TetR family transcriptional regulator [Saccharothrix sp. NRRL B-16348]|jgi:AcrR family transcriptional regulator|uniref:TetR/AcrR family transcriptional regulator n=1 Tax=Saccharothrix sp. NRRL B-16348 TaxID=1415542 RepID=UPI0006AF1241|nr:TetR/AcrR family transcriptional regulator [Saccharothrix sp. NRRL B-16348]KOX18804.1 TetR family transcriptional regulator [Saccharothrix sp. NRRL B-16348]